MSKKSLPLILYQTLEKHAQDADIDDDEELQDILHKLHLLNKKIEEFKQRAHDKKVEKAPNVFLLKSSPAPDNAT
jgi:hypothetical protein